MNSIVKSITTVLLVLLLIILFCHFLFDDGQLPTRIIDKNRPAGKEDQTFKLMINKAIERTELKNKTLAQNILDEQRLAISEKFKTVEGNIEPIIQKLSGFKGCAKLSYLMAKDKLNNSAEAETFIIEVLKEDLIEPTLEIVKNTETALIQFDQRLAENHVALAVEIAAAAGLSPIENDIDKKEDFQKLIEKLVGLPKPLEDMAILNVFSAITISIEGIYIKSTVASVQKVLGAIAERMGITTAASLTAAASDGPLPIGDIVAVVMAAGGAILTAYDLYKAQFVLKKEVRDTLEEAIMDYKRKTISNFEKELQLITDKRNESNISMANALISKL